MVFLHWSSRNKQEHRHELGERAKQDEYVPDLMKTEGTGKKVEDLRCIDDCPECIKDAAHQ